MITREEYALELASKLLVEKEYELILEYKRKGVQYDEEGIGKRIGNAVELTIKGLEEKGLAPWQKGLEGKT